MKQADRSKYHTSYLGILVCDAV